MLALAFVATTTSWSMLEVMNQSFSVFAAILALGSCLAMAESSPTASPAPKGETGLEGRMTVSPIHGGPIREGEDSSGPMVKRIFVVLQGETVVAEFQTDEQGRFKVLLPPGSYIIKGKDPKHRFDHHGPRPVQVLPDKMTPIEWDFDTGMR